MQEYFRCPAQPGKVRVIILFPRIPWDYLGVFRVLWALYTKYCLREMIFLFIRERKLHILHTYLKKVMLNFSRSLKNIFTHSQNGCLRIFTQFKCESHKIFRKFNTFTSRFFQTKHLSQTDRQTRYLFISPNVQMPHCNLRSDIFVNTPQLGGRCNVKIWPKYRSNV